MDDSRISELLEESQDIHSDGIRAADAGLARFEELYHQEAAPATADPSRRSLLRTAVFGAGVLGAGVGVGMLSKAFVTVSADSNMDIQQLQTAAALENLAVAVYKQVAGLDPKVSGAAIPTVAAFVGMTLKQHQEHADAFNAALTRLNAKTQPDIEKKVKTAVVDPAVAKIKGPVDVLGLAATLEGAAATTYVNFSRDSTDPKTQELFATVAPIEAQHQAIILAVSALVQANLLDLIVIPTNVAKLPDVAGKVGFPNNFWSTQGGVPADDATVS